MNKTFTSILLLFLILLQVDVLSLSCNNVLDRQATSISILKDGLSSSLEVAITHFNL